MARQPTVNLTLAGDASRLTKAFEEAGSEAKEMARDFDRASGDAKGSLGKLGDGADASEQKFIGLRDTITGTGDIMDGFRTGNVVSLLTGFADLASGIFQFVVPALTAIKTFMLTQLAPAMSFIAAHPLILAIAATGAIIVGLVLLEKKFGLVSKAVNAVKDAATTVFNWFETNWKLMANIVTAPFTAAFNAVALAWNNTVGKLSFKIPSWVPSLGGKGFDVPDIPLAIVRHTGGLVPGNAGQDVLAMLQAGERVVPRGQSTGMGNITVNVSGVGMGRDFGMAVAQALRDNKLIGVT